MKVLDLKKSKSNFTFSELERMNYGSYRTIFMDWFKKLKTLLGGQYLMEFRYSESAKSGDQEKDVVITVSSSIRMTLRDNDWITYEVSLDDLIPSDGDLRSDMFGSVVEKVEKRLSTPETVIQQGTCIPKIING